MKEEPRYKAPDNGPSINLTFVWGVPKEGGEKPAEVPLQSLPDQLPEDTIFATKD